MTTKTQNTSKRLLLVGDLQVYGTPYASLYMREQDKLLFVFVRLEDKENSTKGILSPVNSDSILLYLNGKETLSQLVANSPRLCDIQTQTGYMLWSVPYKSHSPIANNNEHFNEYFCDDEIEIKIFLNKYKSSIAYAG